MKRWSILRTRSISMVLGMTLFLMSIGDSVLAKEDLDARSLAGKKILFLGDSITYGGHYVELFELAMRVRFPEKHTTILNLGLSSETVSGLSEDGHAGGRFPRPDLFERLDRVLNQVKPDVVFTCYGMNCGIYKPLSSNNLIAYMERYRRLAEKIDESGAELIIVTPPSFDPLPIIRRTTKDGVGGPFSGYDSVLQTFSLALEKEFQDQYLVININAPMTQYVLNERRTRPDYSLARDGVHMNTLGHTITFETIIDQLGFAMIDGAPILLPENKSIPTKYREDFNMKYNTASLSTDLSNQAQKNVQLFKLIREKQSILKDTWLTKTGHKRPGVRKLEPFEDWIEKADDLEKSIVGLLSKE